MAGVTFGGADLVRPRHRMLRALFCLFVLLALVVWGFYAVVSDFNRGLSGLGAAVGRAITESGAVDAARVSNLAAAEKVTPGFLSAAVIQDQIRGERLVPGNVTAAAGTNELSLLATDNHVITAIDQAGYCFYGLSVGTADDPIVGADGLPGAGVYSTAGSSACAADQAPASGWSKVSKADLSLS